MVSQRKVKWPGSFQVYCHDFTGQTAKAWILSIMASADASFVETANFSRESEGQLDASISCSLIVQCRPQRHFAVQPLNIREIGSQIM